MDVELFALTAGGVNEPKAEWTDQARRNLTDALVARSGQGQVVFQPFPGDADETVAERVHLNRAVAQAISIHHFHAVALPSKAGRLDWSMGEQVGAVAFSREPPRSARRTAWY